MPQMTLAQDDARRADAATAAGRSPSRVDWHLWLAVLLAAVIIVPRSGLVAHAQSEGFDDEYHLARGVAFWHRDLEGARLNDPPLGAAITALPLVAVGCRVPDGGHVLYGQHLSTEKLLLLVALWKSLLFLPLVGLAFCWLRRVYGLHAAWIGAVLLSVEPNFAAFIPSSGLDVLAAEGIFVAALLAWRYFERPTIGRLAVMSFATAVAILLKHTAIVVPILIVAYGLARLMIERRLPRRRLVHAPIGVAIFLLSLWALLLFDISKPTPPKDPTVLTAFEQRLFDHRLPGGSYIGSIIVARAHVDRGHPAYLLGRRSLHGWWYYFPVVATYKVPIGVMIMLVAAVASLAIVPPRRDEWMLVIGLVASSAFFMQSGISIGFRHFLPSYLFLLLLATRCVLPGGMIWKTIGWTGVSLTALHGVSQHPNYIAYINFPRGHVWLKISDSNLEWGQSLKQVGQWLDDHPPRSGQHVYLAHYLAERGPHAQRYIGDRAIVLTSDLPMPKTGLLIISPTWLVSAYQHGDRYESLRLREPIDIIAGSMLVFDLDQPITTQPAAKKPPPRRRRSPTSRIGASSPVTDAVATIRPALEARLREIKDHEALSKSTDGTL